MNSADHDLRCHCGDHGLQKKLQQISPDLPVKMIYKAYRRNNCAAFAIRSAIFTPKGHLLSQLLQPMQSSAR